MSSARILSAALHSGVFSEIKLVFEDHTEEADQGPLELVIPLRVPMCTGCQNRSKVTLRRPFTFTSIPFPFNLNNYPFTPSYPSTREAWTEWSVMIFDWFRDVAHERKTDEWRWAVNIFWVCYLGSTPRFPAIMNTEVNWSPDIVPISGELMSMRAIKIATDEYTSWEKIGGMIIGELVDWVALRAMWIAQGVDVEEYHRRIVVHEF